jgi:hypothetical protein
MALFETDFIKKLAILEEQHKIQLNLLEQENKALLAKLKEAEEQKAKTGINKKV